MRLTEWPTLALLVLCYAAWMSATTWLSTLWLPLGIDNLKDLGGKWGPTARTVDLCLHWVALGEEKRREKREEKDSIILFSLL